MDIDRGIGCYSCMLVCARTLRKSFAPSRASLQIHTAGGFQSKFVADICRGCDHAPCALVCKYGALMVREGGGVKFREDKCVGCGECVEACIIDVLPFDEDRKKSIPCKQMGKRSMHVLDINLTSQQVEVSYREDLVHYLGGSGLAAKLFFRTMDPALDALHPDQPLILANGPLNTIFPVVTKVVAVFRSPLTGEYGYSHADMRLAVATGVVSASVRRVKKECPSPV